MCAKKKAEIIEEVEEVEGLHEGLIAKSMTLRSAQYDEISAYAAYNKLTRKKPNTVSAVVRDALDLYLSKVDGSFREFMNLALDNRNKS